MKNAAISRASNSGSSAGAKCPPLGIEVHRRTLYRRSGPLTGRCSLIDKRIGEDSDASWHVDELLWSKRDSEPPVVVVEVVPHRRCDRLGDPIERDRGQQEIAGEALIEITAGIGPGAPLLQNPGGEPSRRVVQPVSERLGLRRLDCLVTKFLLPKCRIALAIGCLRRG